VIPGAATDVIQTFAVIERWNLESRRALSGHSAYFRPDESALAWDFDIAASSNFVIATDELPKWRALVVDTRTLDQTV
jgi:hypothetical protein